MAVHGIHGGRAGRAHRDAAALWQGPGGGRLLVCRGGGLGIQRAVRSDRRHLGRRRFHGHPTHRAQRCPAYQVTAWCRWCSQARTPACLPACSPASASTLTTSSHDFVPADPLNAPLPPIPYPCGPILAAERCWWWAERPQAVPQWHRPSSMIQPPTSGRAALAWPPPGANFRPSSWPPRAACLRQAVRRAVLMCTLQSCCHAAAPAPGREAHPVSAFPAALPWPRYFSIPRRHPLCPPPSHHPSQRPTVLACEEAACLKLSLCNQIVPQSCCTGSPHIGQSRQWRPSAAGGTWQRRRRRRRE